MQLARLGRYRILRVLGRGAMGVVYEAIDPNLERRVALKTVRVEGLSPTAAAQYEERFRTEARSAARLHHPNVVLVHDAGREGDTAYLVMEYVDGDDLKHHLENGIAFSPQEALHLVLDLLAALGYAHEQGVIHRDIKPANLLVEPAGRLKLTDFGVARIAGEATLTQGSLVGTIKYMAPELVQGQKVDARADLFSAAVVAYQLFTGARPFDGDNDFSILRQVIEHSPPPASSVQPALPAALDAVLDRALAKDREQRFQSAADFAQALRAAFGDVMAVPPTVPAPVREEPTVVDLPASEPGAATRTGPPPPTEPTTVTVLPPVQPAGQALPPRRKNWAAPAGALLAVVVAAGGWWFLGRPSAGEPAAASAVPGTGAASAVARPAPASSGLRSGAAVTAPAPQSVARRNPAEPPRRSAEPPETQPPASVPPQQAVARERVQPRSASAPASEARPVHAQSAASSPDEACKDRMWLAREYCLLQECAKPEHHGAPTCVRLRREEELRRGTMQEGTER